MVSNLLQPNIEKNVFLVNSETSGSVNAAAFLRALRFNEPVALNVSRESPPNVTNGTLASCVLAATVLKFAWLEQFGAQVDIGYLHNGIQYEGTEDESIGILQNEIKTFRDLNYDGAAHDDDTRIARHLLDISLAIPTFEINVGASKPKSGQINNDFIKSRPYSWRLVFSKPPNPTNMISSL